MEPVTQIIDGVAMCLRRCADGLTVLAHGREALVFEPPSGGEPVPARAATPNRPPDSALASAPDGSPTCSLDGENGPPAHWAERVRQHAPELLERWGARQSGTPFAAEPGRPRHLKDSRGAGDAEARTVLGAARLREAPRASRVRSEGRPLETRTSSKADAARVDSQSVEQGSPRLQAKPRVGRQPSHSSYDSTRTDPASVSLLSPALVTRSCHRGISAGALAPVSSEGSPLTRDGKRTESITQPAPPALSVASMRSPAALTDPLARVPRLSSNSPTNERASKEGWPSLEALDAAARGAEAPPNLGQDGAAAFSGSTGNAPSDSPTDRRPHPWPSLPVVSPPLAPEPDADAADRARRLHREQVER